MEKDMTSIREGTRSKMRHTAQQRDPLPSLPSTSTYNKQINPHELQLTDENNPRGDAKYKWDDNADENNNA
jgi:hypothetical protein